MGESGRSAVRKIVMISAFSQNDNESRLFFCYAHPSGHRQGPTIQAPEKYECKKIKGLAQGPTRQVPAKYGCKKNAGSAQGPAIQAQEKYGIKKNTGRV